jgi:alpha-1,2-mannosyltransferase
VVPDESRIFWTDALWNTSRVGSQSFVSNQSLNGVVNRWDPQEPAKLVWVALVLLVLAVWAWRSREAVQRGDEASGLALTGIVGVLVSPITWVHHLVWVMPALVLLVDRALVAGVSQRRRRWLLGLALVSYLVMCSRLVWAFNGAFDTFVGWVGSNAYVWLSLTMLFALPLAKVASRGRAAGSADALTGLSDLDRELAATLDAHGARVPAQDESGARRLVAAEHK